MRRFWTVEEPVCNDFEPCVVDVDFVQRLDLSDESEEEYVYSTSKKYPSLPITNVGKMKLNKSKTLKSPSVQDAATLFCDDSDTIFDVTVCVSLQSGDVVNLRWE